MDSFSRALGSVNGACKPIIGLALNLAVLFFVVSIVFPGATPDGYNIVTNVTGVVNYFIAGGLAGLVTLMVFMALWRD
jgi:hypothetical protein